MSLTKNQNVIARAAIDFGSGALKIHVGLVNLTLNKVEGIPLLLKYVPLNLTEDVKSNNGYISDGIFLQAFDILQNYKQASLLLSHSIPLEFSGIATAAFRHALNGVDILRKLTQKTEIPFNILSEEEEGILGFETGRVLFPKIQEYNLLTWDSGNGSFQMTAKKNNKFLHYNVAFGQGTVRILLGYNIRKGPSIPAIESGNPISYHEFFELKNEISHLLPQIPSWLSEKLNDSDTFVSVYGESESIFTIAAQAISFKKRIKEKINCATIFKEEVKEIILEYLDKDDSLINSRDLHTKTLTSSIHLYTIMEHLNLDKINFKRALGNTFGMMLYPKLWKINEVNTLEVNTNIK